MNKIFSISLVLVIGLLTTDLQAQSRLSEEALFRRCFLKLSQQSPKLNDPLLISVKNGSKSAIQACSEVLDSALLTEGGGLIDDDGGSSASKVLETMHNVHGDFFREKKLHQSATLDEHSGAERWYPEIPGAHFLTRALFNPNIDIDSLLKGNLYLQEERSIDKPGAFYPEFFDPPSVPPVHVLDEDAPIPPLGDLLGISPISVTPSVAVQRLPNFSRIGGIDRSVSVPTINFTTLSQVRQGFQNSLGTPITEYFAVRTDRTKLIITTAGFYTFYLTSDDAAVLAIPHTVNDVGRSTVIDNATNPVFTRVESEPIFFEPGEKTFTVRYLQKTGGAKLHIEYAGPGFTRRDIPQSALTHQQENDGPFFSGAYLRYYNLRPTTQNKDSGPYQFTGNEGGGLLGNHAYLHTTFKQGHGYKPNGQTRTNRTWARALLNDFLCKDLPAVRTGDVSQYVIDNSEVSFRGSAQCTTCHATADPLAGLIRTLRWTRAGGSDREGSIPDIMGYTSFYMETPTEPSISDDWLSDTLDEDYHKRPPTGRLYFRNYRGELINRNIADFDDLGDAILDQDDFYVCMAQKYYHYLLGIEVNTNDPGNSTYAIPTDEDLHHYTQVINIGLRLKNHKDPIQTVKEIIALPEFAMDDFGISYDGEG